MTDRPNIPDKMHVRPALLVIDMQNDFNNPITRLYSPRATSLVPMVNSLAAAARAGGKPILWVVQEHRRQLVDFGRERDISPVHCVEGTYGAALLPGLERLVDDFVVIKRRYSGFYATDLDLLLRCLGVNTLILTGIATEGCVQATAMDAHARDYHIRVVSDATAGYNDRCFDAALNAMSHLQPGVIIESNEATRILVE